MASDDRGSIVRRWWVAPEVRAAVALTLVLIISAIATPHFADLQWRDGRLVGAMVDVLRNGAPVVLLAVGMTLVIAAAGIDLSVGSVMALAGTVTALLLTRMGWGSGPAALAGVVAGAGVGTFNGLMVGWAGLQPIVATLVMLVAARGAAQALASDQKVRFSSALIEGLARSSWLGLPVPVFVALGVAGVAALAVRWTLLGMALEAVGENARAARLCGVRVRGTRLLTYALSGAGAGIAGLIAAGDIGEADTANCGMYLELDAILAVVIGGTALTGGRAVVIGSVLGALLMQTLNVALQMNGVPTEHGLVVKAVVVLAVCLARSAGVVEGWRKWRARRGGRDARHVSAVERGVTKGEDVETEALTPPSPAKPGEGARKGGVAAAHRAGEMDGGVEGEVAPHRRSEQRHLSPQSRGEGGRGDGGGARVGDPSLRSPSLPQTRRPESRRGPSRGFPPVLVSVALLAVMIVFAAVRYHDQHFLSARTLVDLLSGHAMVGVIAVGMTFVILSGGIDLSVGAVMGLCNVAIAVMIMEHHWPAWAALAAAPLAGALIGAAQGWVIHASKLPAFIVTLAGMFLARGLAYMVSLESVGIDDGGHAALAAMGVRLAGVRVPVSALVLLGVVALGSYVARWTSFGRNIYAVGGAEEAAGLMGLHVRRTRIAVYAISGLCAGLAAAVLSLELSSGSHTEGVGLELDAIAAVVIGGTLLSGGAGTVLGTLVGVLLTGLVVNVITAYEGWLSSGMTKVVVAGLLLGFVGMQRVVGRKSK